MELNIQLETTQYPIYIESNILNHVSKYLHHYQRVCIFTDENIPEKYYAILKEQFEYCIVKVLPSGEKSKSLAVYEECLLTLLENHFERSDLCIALGGGVIGDLIGFVASSYKRGMDFVQIPTTTLSQIDSSIGGKVGINLKDVKNGIGAFYHPKAVFIDPTLLQTLPKRHFYAGLVEGIKAGLIHNKDLYELFKEYPLPIETIIYEALKVKKYYVEKDEKECHIRKILNFGHTFGHAIESFYHFDTYYHGECVGLGMLMMIKDKAIQEDLRKMLESFHLPTTVDVTKEALLPFILNDKKISNGKLTIVKIQEIGKASLESISDIRSII